MPKYKIFYAWSCNYIHSYGNIQHVGQNSFINTIVTWFRTSPLSTKPQNELQKLIYDRDIPKDKYMKL